jgi:hypothetical protein
MEWARKGEAADTVFRRDDAANSLVALVAELKPLLLPIRERWLAKKQGGAQTPKKKGNKGDKVRVAHAVDTDEMKLARAHWKRFKEYIGRRKKLEEFLKHVVDWIPRDPTTRGQLHYRPPTSTDLYPFWLTE